MQTDANVMMQEAATALADLAEPFKSPRSIENCYPDLTAERCEEIYDVGLLAQLDALQVKIMLVYQRHIANVFQVDCFNVNPKGRQEKRLTQGTFAECEAFVKGCGAMGAVVRTVHCNVEPRHDVARMQWTEDMSTAPGFTSEKKKVEIN